MNSNALNDIDWLERRIAELRDLERLRADKLRLEVLCKEQRLILTQCKEALEQSAPTNGTSKTLRQNVLKVVNSHFGIDEDAA